MDSDAWFVENFLADDDIDLAQRLLAQHEHDQQEQRAPRACRRVVMRNTSGGHANIVRDYLCRSPTYTDEHFERRYLLPKALFEQVVRKLVSHDIMVQKFDAAGRPGATPEQKVLCALRLLQTGSSLDSQDEYCRISESSARLALREFCAGIDSLLGAQFLRWPTVDDLAHLYSTNARRGFPGMIGSVDCTHWAWESCPRAYAGQYKGKEKRPTIVIEAVADSDTRIWHLFVGTPGACNDINVLDRSPLMHHFLNSTDPMHQLMYTLNGNSRRSGYLLADGIYPDYAVLVKPLSATHSTREDNYNIKQAAVRKDDERAFGILKGRYGILEQSARWRRVDDLVTLVRACVILHNLRIECKESPNCFDSTPSESPRIGVLHPMIEMVSNSARIMSQRAHQTLRQDLMSHLWRRRRSHITTDD